MGTKKMVEKNLKKREQKEKREQREKRKQRGNPVERKKQKEVEEGNDEIINHKSLCIYKIIFSPNGK